MKRVFRTLLLSILIVMTLGTGAQAKDIYNYKEIATKQNTWYRPKSYESTYNGNWVWTNTYYRYKVRVPANYYITLTVYDKNYDDLYLYNALKANSDNYIDYYYNNTD